MYSCCSASYYEMSKSRVLAWSNQRPLLLTSICHIRRKLLQNTYIVTKSMVPLRYKLMSSHKCTHTKAPALLSSMQVLDTLPHVTRSKLPYSRKVTPLCGSLLVLHRPFRESTRKNLLIERSYV